VKRGTLDLSDFTLEIEYTVRLAEVEPDDLLETIFVQVVESIHDPDEHRDEPITNTVGYARLYYADWDRIDVGATKFDVFDAKSSTMSEIYTAIYMDEDATVRRAIGQQVYKSILVLDELKISPSHRGQGLGSHVMQRVMDVLGRRSGIIAVKPFPIEFDRSRTEGSLRDSPEYIKELKRVERFYRRLGFRRVPKTQIMYYLPL
jgi:GNAT superfamily N-acetyltransferase